MLPDVRGRNATEVFENTKIFIEWEKRAPQCKRSEGDPSPRPHIKWPRTSFRPEYAIQRTPCAASAPAAMRQWTWTCAPRV